MHDFKFKILHIFLSVLLVVRVVRKTRGAPVSRTHENYINLIGVSLIGVNKS
jgi:hypothetical protein